MVGKTIQDWCVDGGSKRDWHGLHQLDQMPTDATQYRTSKREAGANMTENKGASSCRKRAGGHIRRLNPTAQEN